MQSGEETSCRHEQRPDPGLQRPTTVIYVDMPAFPSSSPSLLEVKYSSCPLTLRSFPGGTRGKEATCQCNRHRRHGFNPWAGKIPWRRKWRPTLVFLPGKSHEQRSLGSQKSQKWLSDWTATQNNNLIFRLDIAKQIFEGHKCWISW